MKREGRQHGMIRTYRVLPDSLNPRPGTRLVNKLDSPPTAGLFTKVPTKPTNHSKFTGKCGKPRCTECHIHPASKAKDKAKGTQKLKASDVGSNHRLVTWRVADGRPTLNFSGFSATGMLDHLFSDYNNNDEEHDEEEEIQGYERNDDHVDEHVNYEEMGFFNVDYVIENQIVEDEGWCLVQET